MASGRVGYLSPSATTWTELYAPPTGKIGITNVSVANRNSSTVTIRIAVSASTTPTAGEEIVYDYTLGATGTPSSILQYTGLPVEDGKKVTVYASGTGVSFSAFALEQ